MSLQTFTIKNDGGPAFPATGTVGMSLRDWFAGQALAGMLADSNLDHPSEVYAERVYLLADAMLAERAK